MKKKKLIITLIVILSLLMIGTDYHLAKEDKPPIFSIKTKMAKDGGTTEYLGLGYKVIDYNQIDGRKDVVLSILYE